MILSGKFRKGQRLVEEKLAHRLNVSRNPVQIALLRLRKEKLVIGNIKRAPWPDPFDDEPCHRKHSFVDKLLRPYHRSIW